MRRLARQPRPAGTRRGVQLAATLLALAAAAPAAQAQYYVYGLTNGAAGSGQQLVRFLSTNPSAVTTLGFTGASLTGIDFRPANGVLYGRSASGLYTLDVSTGAATLLGPVGATSGNSGFDFNPTVDRIRSTDGAGTNQRLNPTVVPPATVVDGAYVYGAGDPFAGQGAGLTGAGYTNSDNDPATMTMLFGIDAARRNLVRVAMPNGGDVFTVGSLGLIGGDLATNGFDIILDGGANFAFLAVLGTNVPGASTLFSVDLTTGATTFAGDIAVAGGLQGIALSAVPEPGTYALLATGLVAVAGVARRRRVAR